MTVAKRLIALRTRLGLTQEAIAARRGIARQTYAQFESGKRKPTLDWLHGHATALGADPHELDPRLAAAAREEFMTDSASDSGPLPETT